MDIISTTTTGNKRQRRPRTKRSDNQHTQRNEIFIRTDNIKYITFPNNVFTREGDIQVRSIIDRLVANTFFQDGPSENDLRVIESIITPNWFKIILPEGNVTRYYPSLRSIIETVIARIMTFKLLFIKRIFSPQTNQFYIDYYNSIIRNNDVERFKEHPFNMFFTVVLYLMQNNIHNLENYSSDNKILVCDAYDQMADYFNRGVFCSNTFNVIKKIYDNNMSIIDELYSQNTINNLNLFDFFLVRLCQQVKPYFIDITSNKLFFERINNEKTAEIVSGYNDHDPQMAVLTTICNTIYNNSTKSSKLQIVYMFNVFQILGINVWDYDSFFQGFGLPLEYQNYFTDFLYHENTSLVGLSGLLLYGEIFQYALTRILNQPDDIISNALNKHTDNSFIVYEFNTETDFIRTIENMVSTLLHIILDIVNIFFNTYMYNHTDDIYVRKIHHLQIVMINMISILLHDLYKSYFKIEIETLNESASYSLKLDHIRSVLSQYPNVFLIEEGISNTKLIESNPDEYYSMSPYPGMYDQDDLFGILNIPASTLRIVVNYANQLKDMKELLDYTDIRDIITDINQFVGWNPQNSIDILMNMAQN